MTISFKKASSRVADSSPDEEEATRELAREEWDISNLGEDEELIDDDTFASLHARFVMCRPASAGPEKSAEAEELLLEEVVAEIPPDRPRREDADARQETEAPASPDEIAALELQLLGATHRDQVARISLRLALCHARVAGLLVVSRGMIAGLCAQGEGLESRIEGVAISAETGSAFAAPETSGEPQRLAAPSAGVDARILRAMGRADAADIAILPIAIHGRVVNLLYVDNGPDRIGETSYAALLTLCKLVARAYERLILSRKRRDSREGSAQSSV
jgi:hypothetical protein